MIKNKYDIECKAKDSVLETDYKYRIIRKDKYVNKQLKDIININIKELANDKK